MKSRSIACGHHISCPYSEAPPPALFAIIPILPLPAINFMQSGTAPGIATPEKSVYLRPANFYFQDCVIFQTVHILIICSHN